jgi:hypothetical protein
VTPLPPPPQYDLGMVSCTYPDLGTSSCGVVVIVLRVSRGFAACLACLKQSFPLTHDDVHSEVQRDDDPLLRVSAVSSSPEGAHSTSYGLVELGA